MNASQVHHKFDKYAVCFMSDGGAAYPRDEILALKSDAAIMSKLDFTVIKYGTDPSGTEILKKMANDLKGTVKEVIDTAELQNAFISLIAEVYGE